MHKILRFAAGLLPPFRRRGSSACPARPALDGFMRGQLDAAGNRRVLLHLIPGCRRCQEITAELWWAAAGRRVGTGAPVDPGPSVDRVFGQVRHIHAGLEIERATARQVLAGLAVLPVHVWPARLHGEPRTWGLSELLLERSRAARAVDPRDAEVLAHCAVAIAGEIPAGSHPAGFVEDLTARAWIAVAEARRACENLAGAEEALRDATRFAALYALGKGVIKLRGGGGTPPQRGERACRLDRIR